MLYCPIIYNLLIIEQNAYVSPEYSICMLPSGSNIMLNVPIVNWIICNSVHVQCPPDYKLSVLYFFDCMSTSNDKDRNLRAKYWISDRDFP